MVQLEIIFRSIYQRRRQEAVIFEEAAIVVVEKRIIATGKDDGKMENEGHAHLLSAS